jgi:hypothetical protein
MTGFCEHGEEHYEFHKSREFLGRVNKHQSPNIFMGH